MTQTKFRRISSLADHIRSSRSRVCGKRSYLGAAKPIVLRAFVVWEACQHSRIPRLRSHLPGVVLEVLADCVMILRSRLRSHLAQQRQSSVGSLLATDVPNGFHLGRPAREACKGTDGSISFARQPSLYEQLVRVLLLKLALKSMARRFLVKECEVSWRAVNLFRASCV